MYESYYRFQTRPFSLLPDPAFLYMSRRHTMAYAMLEYGVTSGGSGYAVITGEIGSGKTTLIRKLLGEIDQQASIGLLHQTRFERDELLQWVLMAFDREPGQGGKADQYHRFSRFVESETRQGKRSILIVDEAQNLERDTLEELRLLTNINTEQGQKLQVILCGQPQLLYTLKHPALGQFAQRVGVQYHLDALSKHEGTEYIRHRLRVAGGDAALFDEAACVFAWYHSRGIPRLINTLCDLALVYGYAEQKRRIDTELMQHVLRDRKNGGLFTEDHDDHNVKALMLRDGI